MIKMKTQTPKSPKKQKKTKKTPEVVLKIPFLKFLAQKTNLSK
jgi:hypothetical protein